MACTNPIYALDLGVKENGKRNLKILSKRVDLSSLEQLHNRYGEGNIIPLPCGKCLDCKISKARLWAVRCTLEASLYDDNCFVTLTFDEDHLPSSGDEVFEKVQTFIHSMRDRGYVFRYFGCIERGSLNKRLHAHLIIFGQDFEINRFGSSDIVNQCWPYGYNRVDPCNYSTCNYVARYTTKKFDVDPDERIFMSTRPGIGFGWFKKHPDIFVDDTIIGPFGSSKQSIIPRYFEKLYESMDPEALAVVKAQRIDKASDGHLYELFVHGFKNIEELYEYKECITKEKYKEIKKRKDL